MSPTDDSTQREKKELLDRKGVYHTLWQRQVGESLEELKASRQDL